MEIIFRPLLSQQHLVFIPSMESDTITVSANLMGMAPLQIISSKFNWNRLRVHHAATRVNRFSKVAILRDLKPKLIIVPKTNGQSDAGELINELIAAAEFIESEVINFTHYGYVKEKLPHIEIESVFRALAEKKNNSSIRVLIWDIDSRYLDQTKESYKRFFNQDLNVGASAFVC